MIQSYRSAAIAAASVLCLGACSGGGGGGGEPEPGSYGAYVDETIALRNAHDALPDVDVVDLPTTGTASYVGVAGIGARMELSSQVSLYGTMELGVDFANGGEFSGRIHDIVSNGNVYTGEGAGAVTGELQIANGGIDRNPPDPRFNPHFTADLTGTIVDSEGTLNFDAQVQGRFRGEDLEMAAGTINGLAGPDPVVMDRVAGSFWVAAE